MKEFLVPQYVCHFVCTNHHNIVLSFREKKEWKEKKEKMEHKDYQETQLVMTMTVYYLNFANYNV